MNIFPLTSFFGGKNQLEGMSLDADAVADVLISQRTSREQVEFDRLVKWAKRSRINVDGAFANGTSCARCANTVDP